MYLTVYTRQPSNGAVSTSLPTSDEQGAARFFFRDSRHVIPVRQPYCSLQQIGRSSGTVCQIVTRVGSFADQQIKFSQSGALRATADLDVSNRTSLPAQTLPPPVALRAESSEGCALHSIRPINEPLSCLRSLRHHNRCWFVSRRLDMHARM